MQNVMVRCEGAGMMKLEQLTPLQGELKSLSKENFERLKFNLLEKGFAYPFAVWRNGGKNYILDGHQRRRVLLELSKDPEIRVPTAFPVVFVDAPDRKTALEMLLAFSSQFGELTQESLYEFVSLEGLKVEELKLFVNFDAIRIDNFATGWGAETATVTPTEPGTTPEQRLDTFLNGNIKQIVLYFQNEEFEDVVARLEKVREAEQVEDNTQCVMRLLRFYEDHQSPTA